MPKAKRNEVLRRMHVAVTTEQYVAIKRASLERAIENGWPPDGSAIVRELIAKWMQSGGK